MVLARPRYRKVRAAHRSPRAMASPMQEWLEGVFQGAGRLEGVFSADGVEQVEHLRFYVVRDLPGLAKRLSDQGARLIECNAVMEAVQKVRAARVDERAETPENMIRPPSGASSSSSVCHSLGSAAMPTPSPLPHEHSQRETTPTPVIPCVDLRDATASALASAAAADPPKARTALPVAANPAGDPRREDRNTSAAGTAQTSETLSRDRAFSRATQQSAASKAVGTSLPSWIHGGQKAPAGQCCDRCSLGLGKLKERAALTCARPEGRGGKQQPKSKYLFGALKSLLGEACFDVPCVVSTVYDSYSVSSVFCA